MLAARVLAFAAGAVAVGGVVLSALRSFVVPRAQPVRLTRVVFLAVHGPFEMLNRRTASYASRDARMALFAPVALLILPFAWLVLTGAGFTLLFWGNGVESWQRAFTLAGSSIVTLGFAAPGDVPDTVLSFLAAIVGLGLIALLIAYLPAIYAAFSHRESSVAMLEVRAGSPPSAVQMIVRYHAIHGMEELDGLWPHWEAWFAELEETHTSLASLPFLRSPQPDRSWVTAAGAVLDAASLVSSTLDRPRTPEAELCIRGGFVALRAIADFFGIRYDPDPQRGDDISITREEYDAACAELEEAGVALRADRDEAWLDFAGWRVNYDTVLIALAALVMAPEAPWSADRAGPYVRPPIWRPHRR
jgi:hypothetical protein